MMKFRLENLAMVIVGAFGVLWWQLTGVFLAGSSWMLLIRVV